jgi:hypothetical protein
LPAGVTTNDIMVALAVFEGGTAALSTPSGWTKLADEQSANDVRSALYYRRWQSGDGAPTITCTNAFAANSVIVAYSGALTSGDPTDGTATGNAGSSASPLAQAVTTTQANSVAIALYCHIFQTFNFSGPTSTWTQRFTAGTQKIYVQDKTIVSAGSSGDATVTLSGSSEWKAHMVALKEDGAAAAASLPPWPRAYALQPILAR